MSSLVVKRMKRELQILSRGTAPGISAWPRDEGSRMDIIDAEIVGAKETPYEDGIFRLEIHIPTEYPIKPPRVKFVTKIYHPNIDSEGRICLDSLNMPPKGAWKPSLNISTLLTTIQALMSSPNPDDGLMVDITDEFRSNPALFRKKARQSTLQHACPDNNSNADKNFNVTQSVNAPQSTLVSDQTDIQPLYDNDNAQSVQKKSNQRTRPLNFNSDDSDNDSFQHNSKRLKKKPRQ